MQINSLNSMNKSNCSTKLKDDNNSKEQKYNTISNN